MTYVLYGHPRSGSTAVELALARIGAGYELRTIDLGTDAQREAPYRAVNPQGKIPALLLPDGAVLTESVAILLTLAERHPEAALLPPPASAERAQALRWLMFVATEIYPMVEINDYPERFAPHASSAPALRETARAIWRARWRTLEAAIARGPYLLSTGPWVSDLYIAVVSRWAQQESWRPAHLPKVERLVAAIAAHPVFAPVWERHYPGAGADDA